MDSEGSATLAGLVPVSAFAEASAGVAGTAVSGGVSDSADGLAGDLAGRGSDTGIGARPGSILGGIGPDTVTMAIRQAT